MKRMVLFIVIIFFIMSFFVIDYKKVENRKIEEPIENEMKGIFISYIELNNYIKNKNTITSKNNIIEMIDNIGNLGFNTIIIHVRPFSDAIYDSDIYPYSSTVTNNEKKPEYDILRFFIQECKKRKIQIHAWINPYRITNSTDVSTISNDKPAYKYINTEHIKVIDNKGIFYNPASIEVRNLIVDGIRELVINYDIDGIHFDDYFYPSKDIDLKSYDLYKEKGGTLSLKDYRYSNILTLIKDTYQSIKKVNSKILFGISPEGNIENNYNNHYLNIEELLSKKGYIDYIMPQIYFGFKNEIKPFTQTLNIWKNLIKEKSIKLIPALAFYKVGRIDKYAKNGQMEWTENNDIIKRQILTLKNQGSYSGFSLFRYDYIFNEQKYSNTTISEITNLKDALKRK